MSHFPRYESDWFDLGMHLMSEDKHGRPISIHGTGWPNRPYYDHGEPWITHVSMQGSEASQLQDAINNWDKVGYPHLPMSILLGKERFFFQTSNCSLEII